MNKINISAIVLAISLAYSFNVMAQNMSQEDHKASDKNIVSEYKSAKVNCGSFSGNAKDICVAEAKGKENVEKAELEASYRPSRQARYEVNVAKAEADYAVAKEKCDDSAGNVKNVCVKEAKAALIGAKADATAQLKSSTANATANEEVSAAHTKAIVKGNDARMDAAVDKRDADYSVAKEKCDSLAGGVKETCTKEAKLRYGK